MKLSTKLTIAMVLLASTTAAAVGFLTYYNLEKAFLPRSLERMESDLRVATTQLDSYSGGARADIEGFRVAVALNGIMRARLSGGLDFEGVSEAIWRERMASRFLAELRSKLGYLQFRIIGVDNGGQEIVRVDRASAGAEPRIVADHELQRKGDREYFKQAIKLQPGEIYVSPVELNQENGVVETPLTPILRVAAPVYAPDGKAFGIVIINMDMRGAFDRVRASARPGARVYIVNERGDYLLHPNQELEFGSELGKPTRWQSDFSGLAQAVSVDGIVTRLVSDGEDDRGAGGLAMVRLAGGPSVGVIELVPNAVIMAPALAVRDTSIVVGLIAMLGAALLGALVSRSLTNPLVQMTQAVDRFPRLNLADIPTRSSGEVGVLAKAFARVLTDLRDKAAAFEREVADHRETERARENYEQQVRLFGAAVESSNDVIITNGLDGSITGWNRAAERLFGYTAAEVIGRRIEGFVPQDRLHELQEARSKLFAGESIAPFETVRLAKDGRAVDVSLSVSPIRLPDGSIIGGMVIGHDLTEFKRTRAALRQGAEERRRIFETSQDLILVTDPQGTFMQVSPSVATILGYQPSEMVGHSAIEFIHPDDLENTREEMRSARRGQMTRNFLTRYLHKDGRVVALAWMGTWSEPVRRHFFIGRDMTDMLRAQEALEESARMARGIVDTALDAFVQMDENGWVTDWNSQAKVMFGWSREEATGRKFDELLAPGDDVDESSGFVGLLQSDGRPPAGRFEIDVLRRDKTAIRVELSVTAFRRESGDQVFNIFIRDLTDKIAAEAQLRQSQKMDAVGQLTGGVAHDFNNILTVITGTIEILADAVADKPDLAAITQMIDEAATRGADLTRHLLAFARRQPLQPKEIDVNVLIAETGKLLRPTLGEHIEIETMFADDPWLAFVDPNQLTNAVLNLAINARDAMPERGKLTIETKNVDLDEAYAAMNSDVKPGSYVMLAISDSGIGIPADRLEKVFEPFFTTKEMGKGTGLGLSMVYGFVKQTGGHIKIYSEEGLGTTVRLYLPRSTMQLQSGVEAMEMEEVVGGDERVLVVEDDELVRNYVITQVRSLGYRTLSAANAEQALKLIRDNPDIDVLFTDVIMPGSMNGRQLVDEALKLRPALKTLYTSGYTENAIVHHGRLDPGVLLLAKPYRKADLARMIRQALGTPKAV